MLLTFQLILCSDIDLFFGCLNRDVVVKNLTILAPLDSPNTDGVDPGEEFIKLDELPTEN